MLLSPCRKLLSGNADIARVVGQDHAEHIPENKSRNNSNNDHKVSVVSSNWLATLCLGIPDDIEKVFVEYHAERYPVAMKALKSKTNSQPGKAISENHLREIPSNFLADLDMPYTSVIEHAQFSFLPLMDDNAKVRPLRQGGLHKTLPILKTLPENPTSLWKHSCHRLGGIDILEHYAQSRDDENYRRVNSPIISSVLFLLSTSNVLR